MGIILSKFSFSGIKNIDKEVSIDLMNRIDDKRDGSTYGDVNSHKKVVAVYGPNGSGKTALVLAFNVLKRLLIEQNFLVKKSGYLNNIINHKTKKMNLEIEFFDISNNDKKPIKYSYKISIQKNNGLISIFKEEIKQLKPKNEMIIEIKNGEIITGDFDESFIKRNSGLLRQVTLCDILFREESIIKISRPEIQNIFKNIYNNLNISCAYANEVNGRIDDAGAMSLMNDIDFITFTNPRLLTDLLSLQKMPKTSLDGYKAAAKEAIKFIRLFKPELAGIRVIEKPFANNLYFVDTNFVYDGYEINIDFESTGIKKLFQTFLAFKNGVQSGNVLVVDELDASINDVYLEKLIEYFADYGKGQIIFTTHNTTPMDVINNPYRQKKASLLFLDSESNITEWKKVGGWSPEKVYKKGLIKGLPFNIYAEDFIQLFNKG